MNQNGRYDQYYPVFVDTVMSKVNTELPFRDQYEAILKRFWTELQPNYHLINPLIRQEEFTQDDVNGLLKLVWHNMWEILSKGQDPNQAKVGMRLATLGITEEMLFPQDDSYEEYRTEAEAEFAPV